MIGNDVIDLRDPETRCAAQHPRFESRAFSPGERARWRDLPPRERHWLRWAHWAAKESAYKALRRSDATLCFTPSRFAVEFASAPGARGAEGTEPLEGWVRAGGRALALRVERSHDHLHALACVSPATLDELCAVVRQISATANPRRAVRVLLRESLASGAAQGVTPILERRGRVPVLRIRARTWPVSLSHHGRQVAAVFPREAATAARSDHAA